MSNEKKERMAVLDEALAKVKELQASGLDLSTEHLDEALALCTEYIDEARAKVKEHEARALVWQQLLEECPAELEEEVAAGYEEAMQSTERQQLTFLKNRLMAELQRGETVGVLEGTMREIREIEDALELPAFASTAGHFELVIAARKLRELRELRETIVKSDGQ